MAYTTGLKRDMEIRVCGKDSIPSGKNYNIP